MASRLYRSVESYQVNDDTDFVIALIETERGTMAMLSGPFGYAADDLVPVETALATAHQQMMLYPDPMDVVIVDEQGMWNEEWGVLIPHPNRPKIEN